MTAAGCTGTCTSRPRTPSPGDCRSGRPASACIPPKPAPPSAVALVPNNAADRSTAGWPRRCPGQCDPPGRPRPSLPDPFSCDRVWRMRATLPALRGSGPSARTAARPIRPTVRVPSCPASAVVELRNLGREPGADGRQVAEQRQCDVARTADNRVSSGRDPGHPVGKGHHPLRDRAPPRLVVIQPASGDCLAEGVAILDAGVHPLAPGWAVHVRRVAGQ